MTWKDSWIFCALVILQLTCDKSRSLLLVAQFLNITCLALAMCHKSMFYSELWCSFELDATSAHRRCFLRNVSPTHVRPWPCVILVRLFVRLPMATLTSTFESRALWPPSVRPCPCSFPPLNLMLLCDCSRLWAVIQQNWEISTSVASLPSLWWWWWWWR